MGKTKSDRDTVRSQSVAEFARYWGVSEGKVHQWIKRSELAAVNVASSVLGRRQYRITPEAAREFEQRRLTGPAPKPTRAKRQPGIIEFYKD
jgi:hypothetical protein